MDTLSRRNLLRAGAAAGVGLIAGASRPILAHTTSRPGAQNPERSGPTFAEELVRTPPQTEGPFYPDRLPLDTDNDLLIVNDAITPAVGTITHLTGRVLDRDGKPLRNASVEIWQVDHHGAYLHTESGNAERRDTSFQGFGRFLTASTGEYYFRTVKPVPYPGRTPHIHVKVKRAGKDVLTTQLYIDGEPLNARDGVLRGIRDPKARASVIVPFAPLPGSRIGELAARFDIVLGVTAESV